MDRNLSEGLTERVRALVDLFGLRIGRCAGGVGQVLLAAAAVDVGDGGPLVGIGDHHPTPVLIVARRGRLHRQTQAVEENLAFDGPGEVESAPDRPRRREHLVDR